MSTYAIGTGQLQVGAMASKSPPNPNVISIKLGIDRVGELEHRLMSLLQRVYRLNSIVSPQNAPVNPGQAVSPSPPRSDLLVFKLLETANACHELISQIDDQGGWLEASLVG